MNKTFALKLHIQRRRPILEIPSLHNNEQQDTH